MDLICMELHRIQSEARSVREWLVGKQKQTFSFDIAQLLKHSLEREMGCFSAFSHCLHLNLPLILPSSLCKSACTGIKIIYMTLYLLSDRCLSDGSLFHEGFVDSIHLNICDGEFYINKPDMLILRIKLVGTKDVQISD